MEYPLAYLEKVEYLLAYHSSKRAGRYYITLQSALADTTSPRWPILHLLDSCANLLYSRYYISWIAVLISSIAVRISSIAVRRVIASIAVRRVIASLSAAL